jgi:hypothetical protein
VLVALTISTTATIIRLLTPMMRRAEKPPAHGISVPLIMELLIARYASRLIAAYGALRG